MNPVNPVNILRLLRLLVGGIFIYAGTVKAWDLSGFSVDVQNYRLLPFTLAVATAIYLPWLEIICGVCLAMKKLYSGALSILLGLMLIFMVAMVSAWARGLNISCGCFTRQGTPTNYFLWMLLDFAFFVSLITLLLPLTDGLTGQRRRQPDGNQPKIQGKLSGSEPAKSADQNRDSEGGADLR